MQKATPTVPIAFYADPKVEAPKVELTEDHLSATATVDLGDKAAVLVGRVVDAVTGAPLKAKLIFMDEDGNSYSVLVTGKYRALIPAGKDVTLMVMVMSSDYDSQTPYLPAPFVGTGDGYGHPASKRGTLTGASPLRLLPEKSKTSSHCNAIRVRGSRFTGFP